MKARLRGAGGHGSLPFRGGAMAKLGRLLLQLDEHRLPVHITRVPQQMLQIVIETLPEADASIFRRLLDPQSTDEALDTLGPRRGQLFDPILHNTVNVTILQGSTKINVVPGEVNIEMDGRLLPGFTPDDMLAELRQLIGDEVELEIARHYPGQREPDMGFYHTLAAILREADPASVPIPFLMPVVTDGRFFSKLGIQTYGFLPTPLPSDFDFLHTVHASNERIPVAAMEFGTQAMYQAIQRNKG
jgi:acetylornithine deacetylase/succinyl-diaminopimelate desuccinylase-like protein